MNGPKGNPLREIGADFQVFAKKTWAKMKSPSWVFYACVFGVFLLLGAWSGKVSAEFTPRRGPLATLSAISPPPTPANGQRNLLVIGVDRLNTTQPRLESLWMLGYFVDRPQVSLVPLYPSTAGLTAAEVHQYETSLPVVTQGRPDQELLNLLRQKKIWWNGTVILDETSMIEIIDFLGGVELNESRLNGSLAVSSFPLPWENAAAALNGQIALLQGICKRTGRLTPGSDLRPILNLIPQHLQTDLDTFQAIRDWRELAGGKQPLTCEFPLLSVNLQEE